MEIQNYNKSHRVDVFNVYETFSTNLVHTEISAKILMRVVLEVVIIISDSVD